MKTQNPGSILQWLTFGSRLSSAKLFVTIGLIAGAVTHSALAQTTLLAGYDFQTTTNGGTAAATAPNSPLVYLSNFGTQAGTAGLYLNGTNGSSTFTQATSGNQVTSFAGTGVNAGSGFSTTATGAAALAVVNNSTNGNRIVFKLSTAGYENIVLTYATQKSGTTAFSANQFSYSLDGSSFTSFGSTVNPATSFAVVTADFSTIAALNNQATIYIGYTLNGATASGGNNRLDNIQINGDALPVPEPGTIVGALLLVGAVGWNQRRRLGGLVGLPA